MMIGIITKYKIVLILQVVLMVLSFQCFLNWFRLQKVGVLIKGNNMIQVTL